MQPNSLLGSCPEQKVFIINPQDPANLEKNAEHWEPDNFKRFLEEALSGNDLNVPIDFPLVAVKRKVGIELAKNQKLLKEVWLSIDIDEDFAFPVGHDSDLAQCFKELSKTLRCDAPAQTNFIDLTWVRDCVDKTSVDKRDLAATLQTEQTNLFMHACKVVFQNSYECDRLDSDSFFTAVTERAAEAMSKFFASVVFGFFESVKTWSGIEDAKVRESIEAANALFFLLRFLVSLLLHISWLCFEISLGVVLTIAYEPVGWGPVKSSRTFSEKKMLFALHFATKGSSLASRHCHHAFGTGHWTN